MTATYKLNSEHNGIEIYFQDRPDKEILSKLHEGHWRWHKYKFCWYNKQNNENLAFAREMCNDCVNNVALDNKTNDIKNIHNVKIGDIFYTSFGYDMTLVTYYQVVRVTAKRATVKEIKRKIISGDGLQGKCSPIKDSFVDENKTYTTGTDFSWNGKETILKNCDGHIGYAYIEGSSQVFNSLD